MALSSSIIFEVRTTGSDTNGGGFKVGASGTDWSQQDSAQYNVTDGVTAGTTTITSATANFGTDVVGNLIYVAGGTGSVAAGWYEITGRTNSTTITVDRSTGLTAGTGVTLKIGGALQTIGTAENNKVLGNVTYVKSGTYSISSTITVKGGASGQVTRTAIIGYRSTRGDSGTATIQASAGSFTMLTMSNYSSLVSNLVIDGNSQTSIKGIILNGGDGLIYACTVKNCTANAIQSVGRGLIVNCYFTGNTTSTVISTSPYTKLYCCEFRSNTVTCVTITTDGGYVGRCIFDSNTGASTNGVTTTGGREAIIENCVFYSCGQHGLAFDPYGFPLAVNNIFVSNGGYGIAISTATTLAGVNDGSGLLNNKFYLNTSGAIQGLTLPFGTNAALSGDPFTNAASHDFSLDSTSGEGAACRAAGFPGVFPAGATTGYVDIGAAQHQEIAVSPNRIIQPTNIGIY